MPFKRTALAAVLAATVMPSFAQSSVTLYGQLDIGIGYIDSGASLLYIPPTVEAGRHGVRQVRNTGPSWLGFRGTEDLGGGWSAGFDLQHRLMVDSGLTDAPPNGAFWQGRSMLYLRSKTLGELGLGRDNYLGFYNGIPADPFLFDYSAAALGPDFTTARYTVPGEGGVRSSNQIVWRSPRWSGFAIAGGMAAGESTGRGRNLSLLATYASGPAYLGLGRESSRLLAGGSRDMVNLTGTYTIGGIKVALNRARTTDDGGATAALRRVDALSFSASAGVGGGTAKLTIGQLDPGGAANETLKVGMGYEYPLSRRTSLKAALATSRTEGLSRTVGYDAGIVHRF